MPLVGDIARLNAMASELERLPLGIRNRVAVAATAAANELLQEEFEYGIAADGSAWEPLAPVTKLRGRVDPPLGGTSVQRDVKARRVGTHVAVESSTVAGYHQRGHRTPTRLPRRPMWPEEGDGLPDRWQLRLSLAANGAMLEAIHASGLLAAE